MDKIQSKIRDFGLQLAQVVGFKMQKKVLIMGPSKSGKTSLLKQLKEGRCTAFFIGLTKETITYKEFEFVFYDIGEDMKRNKSCWQHFYNVDAILYVVDAADIARSLVAGKELFSLLQRDELKNAVVLILANKQDLPQALNVNVFIQSLQLENIQQKWQARASSTFTGFGVYNCFEMLRQLLLQQQQTNF